jgi:FKBP-type peptidyl-prolyl cis-trans isomerase
VPVAGLIVCNWLVAQPASEPATQPTTEPAFRREQTVTASGLTIIKLEPGVPARENDIVYVRYTGRLSNGTVFDASSLHGNEPIPVTLGGGQVIKGWEEGLRGTMVGEKRKLIIPPKLGYGELGRGDQIPPNATLEFDIEVVGITRGI